MTTTIWTSVIAVLGTLLGGLLASAAQARTARTARQATVADQRRSETVTAVTALAAVLAEHRRATWIAETTRLSDADEQACALATAATHDTWSAVTAPLATVKILAPQFTAAAEHVTDAIYTMLGAPDQAELEARRADARTAHDQLLRTASQYFDLCPGGAQR